MPQWPWFVDSILLVVALVIAGLVLVVVRRRVLGRSRGAFEMSVNKREQPTPKGWALGVAVYRSDEVEWYRTLSLSWRPRHRFPRGEVLVERRRDPQGQEAYVLQAGHVIVSCATPSGVRQMAMNPTSLTGLLAWLESSPPGRGVNRVV